MPAKKKQHRVWGIVSTMICLSAVSILSPLAATSKPLVRLEAQMDHAKVACDAPASAYLRLAAYGADIPSKERAPVNIAIALDKSGSMGGEKIQQARESARMVVDRLGENDILSIIAYDSRVSVIMPATKVVDREAFYRAIDQIQADGGTALFAGVSKAAAEVRKFADKQHLNRIILLSDGQANEGPSSPEALGELGATLFEEAFSVTTIGLGLHYNDDLMVSLAKRSNGSHLFAETPTQLAKEYDREFKDVLTAVGQNAKLTFTCAEGVRPVRVIGRDAAINGQSVSVALGQLFSKQMKYAVLEVELPTGEAGASFRVGTARISYDNLKTGHSESHSSTPSIHYSDDKSEVELSVNTPVMESVVRQIGMEKFATARELRNQGRLKESQLFFADNAARLSDWGKILKSERLQNDAASNIAASKDMDEESWQKMNKGAQEGAQAVQLQSLGYIGNN